MFIPSKSSARDKLVVGLVDSSSCDKRGRILENISHAGKSGIKRQ